MLCCSWRGCELSWKVDRLDQSHYLLPRELGIERKCECNTPKTWRATWLSTAARQSSRRILRMCQRKSKSSSQERTGRHEHRRRGQERYEHVGLHSTGCPSVPISKQRLCRIPLYLTSNWRLDNTIDGESRNAPFSPTSVISPLGNNAKSCPRAQPANESENWRDESHTTHPQQQGYKRFRHTHGRKGCFREP